MDFYESLRKIPPKHDQLEKKLVDVSITLEAYLNILVPLAGAPMTAHGTAYIENIRDYVTEAKGLIEQAKDLAFQALVRIKRAEGLVEDVNSNLMEAA